MQGGGTVDGSQLVELIASKTCCAFATETQRSHDTKGHHGQHRSHHRQPRGCGSSGPGKGRGGPSGSGTKSRTSMISCASVSVTTTGSRCAAASFTRRSSSAKSGELRGSTCRPCDG